MEITPLTPKRGEKPPIEEKKERISRKRVTKKELMKRVEELYWAVFNHSRFFLRRTAL